MKLALAYYRYSFPYMRIISTLDARIGLSAISIIEKIDTLLRSETSQGALVANAVRHSPPMQSTTPVPTSTALVVVAQPEAEENGEAAAAPPPPPHVTFDEGAYDYPFPVMVLLPRAPPGAREPSDDVWRMLISRAAHVRHECIRKLDGNASSNADNSPLVQWVGAMALLLGYFPAKPGARKAFNAKEVYDAVLNCPHLPPAEEGWQRVHTPRPQNLTSTMQRLAQVYSSASAVRTAESPHPSTLILAALAASERALEGTSGGGIGGLGEIAKCEAQFLRCVRAATDGRLVVRDEGAGAPGRGSEGSSSSAAVVGGECVQVMAAAIQQSIASMAPTSAVGDESVGDETECDDNLDELDDDLDELDDLELPNLSRAIVTTEVQGGTSTLSGLNNDILYNIWSRCDDGLQVVALLRAHRPARAHRLTGSRAPPRQPSPLFVWTSSAAHPTAWPPPLRTDWARVCRVWCDAAVAYARSKQRIKKMKKMQEQLCAAGAVLCPSHNFTGNARVLKNLKNLRDGLGTSKEMVPTFEKAINELAANETSYRMRYGSNPDQRVQQAIKFLKDSRTVDEESLNEDDAVCALRALVTEAAGKFRVRRELVEEALPPTAEQSVADVLRDDVFIDDDDPRAELLPDSDTALAVAPDVSDQPPMWTAVHGAVERRLRRLTKLRRLTGGDESGGEGSGGEGSGGEGGGEGSGESGGESGGAESGGEGGGAEGGDDESALAVAGALAAAVIPVAEVPLRGTAHNELQAPLTRPVALDVEWAVKQCMCERPRRGPDCSCATQRQSFRAVLHATDGPYNTEHGGNTYETAYVLRYDACEGFEADRRDVLFLPSNQLLDIRTGVRQPYTLSVRLYDRSARALRHGLRFIMHDSVVTHGRRDDATHRRRPADGGGQTLAHTTVQMQAYGFTSAPLVDGALVDVLWEQQVTAGAAGEGNGGFAPVWIPALLLEHQGLRYTDDGAVFWGMRDDGQWRYANTFILEYNGAPPSYSPVLFLNHCTLYDLRHKCQMAFRHHTAHTAVDLLPPPTALPLITAPASQVAGSTALVPAAAGSTALVPAAAGSTALVPALVPAAAGSTALVPAEVGRRRKRTIVIESESGSE